MTIGVPSLDGSEHKRFALRNTRSSRLVGDAWLLAVVWLATAYYAIDALRHWPPAPADDSVVQVVDRIEFAAKHLDQGSVHGFVYTGSASIDGAYYRAQFALAPLRLARDLGVVDGCIVVAYDEGDTVYPSVTANYGVVDDPGLGFAVACPLMEPSQ